MKKLGLMALLMLTTFAFAEPNTTNDSFDKSKRLLNKIYLDLGQGDFYCGARFDLKNKITDFNGYVPKHDTARAHRIEYDHIVAAENFGQSFKEWRDGDPACVDNKGNPLKGRDCAEKMNPTYRFMQADMYNLRPMIGELNGLKSNYGMAMIGSGAFEFGACQARIADRKFEPPPNSRGDIARIFFYMEKSYPKCGIISNKNEKLLQAWNKSDPVDAFECALYAKIKTLQGNENEILKQACAQPVQPAQPTPTQPAPKPTVTPLSTPTPEPPASACMIKGNIDAKGHKFYYLPGDKGYGSVKIDASQGEKMFCSEAEAKQAGWKRKE